MTAELSGMQEPFEPEFNFSKDQGCVLLRVHSLNMWESQRK